MVRKWDMSVFSARTIADAVLRFRRILYPRQRMIAHFAALSEDDE